MTCKDFAASKLLAATAVLGVLALAAPAAIAGNTTGTIAVSTSIAGSCSVSATALSFAAYAGTAEQAQSTVTLNCTNGSTGTISLDQGQNNGKASTYGTRAMKNGTSYLGYDIFKDSGLGTVWNTTNTVSYTSSGTALTYTAYGSLPAGQTGPAGNYTDTVTITATF